MKLIFPAALLFVAAFCMPARAQDSVSFRWAQPGAGAFSSNPIYIRQATAASGSYVLFASMREKLVTSGNALGTYLITLHNAQDGSVADSLLISGKVSITNSVADDDGNWYLLGSYYDTVKLSSSMQLTRGNNGPESAYFICRLNATTLHPDWLVPVGGNNFDDVRCIAANGNMLLAAIDSTDASYIVRYNLNSGARNALFTQQGSSFISSIKADNSGAICVYGSCAETALKFNNSLQTPPAGDYTQYVVRYHPDLSYHWHYWMTDITCTLRDLQVSPAGNVYLSGALNDTLTLAGHNFHASVLASPLNDYIIARLDSNGTLQWARQNESTGAANAGITVSGAGKSALFKDSVFYLLAGTRGTVNWGSGISSSIPNNTINSTIVAFGAASGDPLWARAVASQGSVSQNISTAGQGIFITGSALDTGAVAFGNILLPGASPKRIGYIAALGTDAAPQAVGQTGAAAGSLFQISPNPATSAVFVHCTGRVDFTAELTDVCGRIVRSAAFTAVQAVGKLDTESLPRGCYFLKCRAGSRQQSMTVVLQ